MVAGRGSAIRNLSKDPVRYSIGTLYSAVTLRIKHIALASRFPMVLGAMAAAYESETHGGTAEASARLRGLVKQWQVANGEMLNQTITSGIDKAHLREKLVKMLA